MKKGNSEEIILTHSRNWYPPQHECYPWSDEVETREYFFLLKIFIKNEISTHESEHHYYTSAHRDPDFRKTQWNRRNI